MSAAEPPKSAVEKKAWIRPNAVISLHKLKQKKKALQARINRTSAPGTAQNDFNLTLNNTTKSFKRKNPFLKNDENKKPKTESPEILSESSDATLFKLLHPNDSSTISASNPNPLLSFTSVLIKLEQNKSTIISANQGEKWIPIDWTLKSKLRLMSSKPFAWNRTLKTSEEASGITGYVRCLDTSIRTNKSLDTSPNAQFHQCCLYWQHPALPWLQLFPRSQGRVSATVNNFASTAIKESLQSAWTDSFRSLFQLVRARQCPYFYVCANTFTACFRAAGICGYTDMHVLLTPTTRGFRHLLRQEDIAFTMPLKEKNRTSDGTLDSGYDSSSQIVLEDSPKETEDPVDDEDEPVDQWLNSLGVNGDEIKKINNYQAQINHRTECEVDNSEESLIFVKGVEAHGLYNFLLNCKSIVANIGPLAGVPPTLLAPVGFHGATLQSLKVRDNRIRDNNSEYYSMEFDGPILPHTLHNLYSLLPKDSDVSATFANIASTEPFSKVKVTQTCDEEDPPSPDMTGSVFFREENLTDCGLSKELLKDFCSAKPGHVQHYDSLKYISETGLYICL